MSDVGEHKPSDPPVVQETGGTSVEVLREVRKGPVYIVERATSRTGRSPTLRRNRTWCSGPDPDSD
jgi:hypothetical protein